MSHQVGIDTRVDNQTIRAAAEVGHYDMIDTHEIHFRAHRMDRNAIGAIWLDHDILSGNVLIDFLAGFVAQITIHTHVEVDRVAHLPGNHRRRAPGPIIFPGETNIERDGKESKIDFNMQVDRNRHLRIRFSQFNHRVKPGGGFGNEKVDRDIAPNANPNSSKALAGSVQAGTGIAIANVNFQAKVQLDNKYIGGAADLSINFKLAVRLDKAADLHGNKVEEVKVQVIQGDAEDAVLERDRH